MPSAKLLEVEPLSPSKYDIYMSQVGKINQLAYIRLQLPTVQTLPRMCPTFLIGCLPTYAHVGWFSTALLVVLRLLQGIAIGGEYVSALVFSMEHAPGHQKTISGALMRLGAGH